MRRIAMVAVAALLGGCSSGEARPAVVTAATPTAATPAPATPEPATPGPRAWRKPRYIPVHVALERLARHVDVPVVLPRHRHYLRSYRRWLADPKYLDWDRRGDETVGTLHLSSRRDYLLISYGYAIPDGCGGRDTAIPTDVLGDPALLWTSGAHSSIIWPVRPRGRIGRFELNGSFRGHEIHQLAESMEMQLREAPRHDPGC